MEPGYTDATAFEFFESAKRPEYHRPQKLVSCVTENAAGERRQRLVEFEKFRLWEYMMTHKHRLTVSDAVVCMWVDQAQFEARQALYIHESQVEAVNRIILSFYDETYGFSMVVSRFALSEDTDALIEVLKHHLLWRGDQAEECDAVVVEGYCIYPWEREALPPITAPPA
jgi:hypothetical protein